MTSPGNHSDSSDIKSVTKWHCLNMKQKAEHLALQLIIPLKAITSIHINAHWFVLGMYKRWLIIFNKSLLHRSH